MPIVDVQEAIKAIALKKIDPLYLLVGEERYFSARCLSQLRHGVVADDMREFNEDIFYASEVPIDRVIDSLRMLPVMAEKRLVVLREAQLLTEKDWAALDEVQDWSSGHLVFVIQASQLDRRKKTIKKWLEMGTVVECLTPQEAGRAPWIRSLAREKGLELDNQALAYLVQMGGNTLEEIDLDLDKLYLFFGEPRAIRIGDVAEVLQRSREESIFSLAEAVGKKDRPQALFLFHRLQSQGESEIALVSLIARHLRILLKVIKAQQLGLKGPTLAQKVGVNNYFVTGYVQQAGRWSTQEICNALLELAEMDRQLKSSSLPMDLWLERFLLFSHAEANFC
jgi:DNA polymerase-3 subunit delta